MRNEITWEQQSSATINKWYFIGAFFAFWGEFIILYFALHDLAIAIFASVIISLIVIGAMVYKLYNILPLAIGVSNLGIHLKYRKKERTIRWENIERVVNWVKSRWGSTIVVYFDGKRKMIGGDPEIMDKIYNQFQSYKQTQKTE